MGAAIAEELAKKQKEISVAEFFERNKHILGFDSLTKAALTAVKEGMDNSLDACEEADILPEIYVELKKVGRDELLLIIEDNGPGIVKRQVPNVFGRLLYGSRFHAVRQSRGQQGIGISAVVMYGQITTGKPATIMSKVKHEDTAYTVDLIVDTKRNRPNKIREDRIIWQKEHGTRLEIPIKAKYIKSKQSPYEYLKGTAIVNPHATIVFVAPDGKKTIFQRVTDKMPKEAKEIKPHPKGIELGTLLKMAKETKARKINAFLNSEFSRISYRVAHEICEKGGVNENLNPKRMKLEDAKNILQAIKKTRIMAPPTDCLSPIGELLIKKGLKNVLGDIRPDFYAPPITRDPAVHSGTPFQVEVGIVYGGDLPKDQPVTILRFANRVPLLYQQGACVITAAVSEVDWRRYGLEQRGGKGIPYGPAIILVHVASTKIPFTSEAKEAVANITAIKEEIERALRGCARKLQTHLNKKARKVKAKEKFDIVQLVLPQIAEKSAAILNKPVPPLAPVITKIMNVVWVEDKIEYVKKEKRHKVTIDFYNYTPTRKKFDVYSILPREGIVKSSMSLKPKELRKNGKTHWQLPSISPNEKYTLYFELDGLDKDDFDEVELYMDKVKMDKVIGAEHLPGDWDIEDSYGTTSIFDYAEGDTGEEIAEEAPEETGKSEGQDAEEATDELGGIDDMDEVEDQDEFLEETEA